MKRRLLLSIAAIMTLAVMSVGSLFAYFFWRESRMWVDSQVEKVATTLITGDLSRSQLEELDEIDDIVSSTLGTRRLTQVILIYNRRGRLVYRSDLAAPLVEKISRPVAGWKDVRVSGLRFRTLTLPISNGLGFVEVGLELTPLYGEWKELGLRLVLYCSVVIGLVVAFIFILSRLVVSPLGALADYLKHLATAISRASEPSPLPESVSRLKLGEDEIARMVLSVEELGRHAQTASSKSSVWASQMAHELKTPLTVLRNRLEKQLRDPSENQIPEALHDIDVMSMNVMSFLDWAKIENTPASSLPVDAIRFEEVVFDVVKSMEHMYGPRLKVQSGGDLRLFADRQLVRQLVVNLVQNALKYTEGDVAVEWDQDSFSVADRGKGIPPEVLNRVGEPFNSGDSRFHESTGLGLAWVKTVANKYRWTMHVHSNNSGTRFHVEVGHPDLK